MSYNMLDFRYDEIMNEAHLQIHSINNTQNSLINSNSNSNSNMIEIEGLKLKISNFVKLKIK